MSLIGSSSAVQEWGGSWVDHYQREMDLETLRWINEEYEARILDDEQTLLDRVRNIGNPHLSAWQPTSDYASRPDYSPSVEYEDLKASMSGEDLIPRIYLGTGYVMGLVPPAATVGDVLVRFWNCNTAIVMRPVITVTRPTSFMLVGQADLAELTDRTRSALESYVGTLPHTGFRDQRLPGMKARRSGAVFVDLNLRTLQKITAHTTTHSHDTMDDSN
jgi:hypothetical protein